MPKQLSCDVCSKTFARRSPLLRHKQAHGGVKYNSVRILVWRPTPAYILGKNLRTSYSAASHSQKFNLKTHSLIHSGEKPHKCTHCDYSCSVTSSLTTHMKKHSEEKIYNCNQCEYKTAHSSSLKMHERKHTGEKLHHCIQCESKLAKTRNLQTHKTTHSSELVNEDLFSPACLIWNKVQ